MAQAAGVKLGDAESAMFRACMERDIGKLEAALEAGADVFALQDEHFMDPGKSAMHVAAKRGFTEGVVLLRAYGLDVDARDHPIGNTALHILPDQGNAQMFRQMVEMGADLHAKNHRGFDVITAARHMDRVRGAHDMGRVVDHFLALPAREDFAGLTLDEVLERDTQGYCMLDNPAMLRRIGAMGEALARSGTPLTRAALEGESIDGRSYLEKLMLCDRLQDAVAALNAQGEQLHPGEGAATGTLPPLCEQMMRWRQLGAVFTEENWKGQGGAAVMRAYAALPEAARRQVPDIYQLRETVEAAQSKGYGRYAR